MFLLEKLSLADFIGNNEIIALPQQRGHVHYIWNGLVLINNRTIYDIDQLSFHCSACVNYCPLFDNHLWFRYTIEGQIVDVEGAMFFFFREHPKYKIKYLHSTHHITPQRKNLDALLREILNSYDPEFNFELIDQTFFHYGGGSNWKNQSEEYHKKKTELAQQFVIGVINGAITIPYKKPAKKYFDPGLSYRQYIMSFKYWVYKRTQSRIQKG